MNTVDKLNNLKEQIENAKLSKAQLQGKLQSAKESLKKNFSFSELSEAEEYLEEVNKKIAAKKKKLNAKMEQLEEVQW